MIAYTGKIVQYAVAAGPRRNRYVLGSDQVTIYPGKHEPLIDEATFEVARSRYVPGRYAPRRRPRMNLLSGILTCDECGRSAVIIRQNPATYRCHKYGEPIPCESKRLVRQIDPEAAVRAWAIRLANDRRALDLAARDAVMAEWEPAQRLADLRSPVEREISEIEKQIATTFKLIEAGNAPELVNRRLAALETSLEAAHVQLKDIGAVIEPAPVDAARTMFQEQLRAAALDLHQLRGLIDRIQMPADPDHELVLEAGGSTYTLGVLRPRGRWG